MTYAGKFVEWHKGNKNGKGTIVQINHPRGTVTSYLVKDEKTNEIIKIKNYAYPKEWIW